jgi:hypothetical protein
MKGNNSMAQLRRFCLQIAHPRYLTCSGLGALLLFFFLSPATTQVALAATHIAQHSQRSLGGGGFSFVQITTSSNTQGDHTILDHALLNGNGSAVVLAAPVLDLSTLANAFSFDSTQVGVEYNYNLARWMIVNEDSSTMPIGARFNVQGAISQMPSEGAYSLPVDEIDLTSAGQVLLVNAFSTNNPNAQIVVMPEIYQPNPQRDTRTLSVSYQSNIHQWVLAHANGTPIDPNEVFNVIMWPQQNAHLDVTVATNTLGVLACLDDSSLNKHPNATPVVTVDATSGSTVSDPLDLLYDPFSTRWCIFDATITALPVNAQFIVSEL